MYVCLSVYVEHLVSHWKKTQLVKTVFFNSCVLTYKVNFLMMVMATTETCRNVE